MGGECIMYVQTGKTFIATAIAVILSLGGIAVLSGESHKDAPSTLAQTQQSAQTTPDPSAALNDTSSNATTTTAAGQSGYEDGYKAGYRDGHQDCTTSAAGATASGAYYSGRTRVTRAYYPRRSGVAGERYTAVRRGHSTRNMILTIAGPAAVAAGLGGIIHGGKGAGIGALLGGGGGALYYLAKHRRD
jgi:hypothetical protein